MPKLKNIFLPAILLLYATIAQASGSERITLNQLGFYPEAPKVAIITGAVDAIRFYILSATNRDTVFRGILSPQQQSAYSSTITHIADFSKLQQQGQYILAVRGVGESYVFSIANHVQRAVAVASLKGYYFTRSNQPLEKQYAGQWARPAGHPDTVVLIHSSAATAQRPAGSVISSPGGWYDAGDYNKYIVNSGITMGTLLSAYEDFSRYFDTLHTNIPESKNAIPDILDEIIYNLRWMLTMQDPFDGGVYNKCTNADFDGMVMPGVTKAPRYVVQKGTAATLDFAAVTAQAARILQKYNRRLADSCLHASEKAWQWALKYPALAYDQDAINKTAAIRIITGGYGDRFFADEWYWAAAELLSTTGKQGYDSVLKQQKNVPATLPSWSNVRMLGIYTLLRCQKRLPAGVAELIALAKKQLLAMADSLISNGGNKAFQTIMGQSRRDYNWGGSSVAANQGILLINAWCYTQKQQYIEAALSNLDYLLGRNATGYSFVTGIGSKSPMHPHHRPSIADNITAPVPGLLVGGPNPGRQDNCHYDFTEPETCYQDIECSYASNEIAINWNAPLVYLANALEYIYGNKL
ncbi:MAG: glycoside hydrolase family 9 protein [Chitinophagaceae bacterium]